MMQNKTGPQPLVLYYTEDKGKAQQIEMLCGQLSFKTKRLRGSDAGTPVGKLAGMSVKAETSSPAGMSINAEKAGASAEKYGASAEKNGELEQCGITRIKYKVVIDKEPRGRPCARSGIA